MSASSSIVSVEEAVSSAVSPPDTELDIELDLMTEDLLDAVFALELASYPEDEAASLDALKYRLANAPAFFRVAWAANGSNLSSESVSKTHSTGGNENNTEEEEQEQVASSAAAASSFSSSSSSSSYSKVQRRQQQLEEEEDDDDDYNNNNPENKDNNLGQGKKRKRILIGFIVGTAVNTDTLTHDSMSDHHPEGHNLCIHSVVIDPAVRRRGYGLKMLRAFVNAIGQEAEAAAAEAAAAAAAGKEKEKEHEEEEEEESSQQIKRITLVCKKHLIGFYSSAGFTLVGPSDLVHGQDTWYEMNMVLTAE